MYDGRGKVDVSHAFSSDSAVRNFHAASVAGHAFVFHSAIFSAGAFPVFFGTENLFAEESVAFGSICSVVDCFWFFDFSVRPAANIARFCQTDFNGRVIVNAVVGKFVAHRLSLLVKKVDVGDRCGKAAVFIRTAPPAFGRVKGTVPTELHILMKI